MSRTAAGPFAVGDRVRVAAFDPDSEIVGVGETQSIRAFGIGVADLDDELHPVTMYDVQLDNSITRTVADRDGHIVRL